MTPGGAFALGVVTFAGAAALALAKTAYEVPREGPRVQSSLDDGHRHSVELDDDTIGRYVKTSPGPKDGHRHTVRVLPGRQPTSRVHDHLHHFDFAISERRFSAIVRRRMAEAAAQQARDAQAELQNYLDRVDRGEA